MKVNSKIVLLGSLFFVLIIVFTGFLFFNSNLSNTKDNNQSRTNKKSCDILTLELAQLAFGEEAKQDKELPNFDVSNEDVDVTSCSYFTNNANFEKSKSISLLTRFAKSDTGKETNVFGFDVNKRRDYLDIGLMNIESENMPTPAPVEEINIQGAKSFYDPDLKQFNILIDDGVYWLIISGRNIDKSSLVLLAEKMVSML
mgnify:CR=1 FL=1